MVCTTVKEGVECFFMKKNGCQFNGGTCHPIVEQCVGCQKVIEGPTEKYCMNFPDPTVKWKMGKCSMATHVKAAVGEVQKINPLKASKRGTH
ncbi:MAG: PxxKW family cysteine-rich protein [Pseudomonadota bacterium]